MKKGIIYLMTTAVSGVVKIGKTGIDSYSERMRFLEGNGYYNVVGLKRYFAIALEDYDDKEKLIHEIFATSRVGTSELFALEIELVKQLLLAFEGDVIYPENEDKEKQFDRISKTRTRNNLFSFYDKGLKEGDVIQFIDDESIQARVCSEREVLYNEQVWKLSPLTLYLFDQQGKANASRSYQGAAYFTYQGVKLKDLPDK